MAFYDLAGISDDLMNSVDGPPADGDGYGDEKAETHCEFPE